MKAKHTPGPWQVGYNATNKEGFYTIMDKNGIAICKTVNQSTEQAKHEEFNAKLIASAPKILAALKAIIMAEEIDLYVGDEWDNAKQAIAEAEGRI